MIPQFAKRVVRLTQRLLVRIQWKLVGPESLMVWLAAMRPVHRAAVIVAHPDDEVFCGGLICALRRQEIQVLLFLLTRGEGASSPAIPRKELSSLRSAEVTNSAAALGISEVAYLGFEDAGNVHPTPPATNAYQDMLADTLRKRIVESRVTLVVTHGSDGEYGHPAHVTLHNATKQAVRGLAGVVAIGINAWRPNFPVPQLLNRRDRARLFVDGSAFGLQRVKSLKSHDSQIYVFEKFANGTAEDYVRMTSEECYSVL
jgi:LmbE family N-acetylglucosaminyl deacetylase